MVHWKVSWMLWRSRSTILLWKWILAKPWYIQYTLTITNIKLCFFTVGMKNYIIFSLRLLHWKIIMIRPNLSSTQLGRRLRNMIHKLLALSRSNRSFRIEWVRQTLRGRDWRKRWFVNLFSSTCFSGPLNLFLHLV